MRITIEIKVGNLLHAGVAPHCVRVVPAYHFHHLGDDSIRKVPHKHEDHEAAHGARAAVPHVVRVRGDRPRLAHLDKPLAVAHRELVLKIQRRRRHEFVPQPHLAEAAKVVKLERPMRLPPDGIVCIKGTPLALGVHDDTFRHYICPEVLPAARKTSKDADAIPEEAIVVGEVVAILHICSARHQNFARVQQFPPLLHVAHVEDSEFRQIVLPVNDILGNNFVRQKIVSQDVAFDISDAISIRAPHGEAPGPRTCTQKRNHPVKVVPVI